MTKKNVKRTPPFQSKLNPYKSIILAAWRERCTLRQIRAWLLSQDVIITLSGLSSFIHRRVRRRNPHELAEGQVRFSPGIRFERLSKICLTVENKALKTGSWT